MYTKEDYYTVQTASTMLNIGPNTLFKILRNEKIFTPDNVPLEKYRKQGLFKTVVTQYSKGPVNCNAIKPMVSAEGINFLSELLNEMERDKRLLSGKRRTLPRGQNTHNKQPNVVSLRRVDTH